VNGWTYAGVQVAADKKRRVQFGALLVNDTRGFTFARVYYNSRQPVRIVYIEEPS